METFIIILLSVIVLSLSYSVYTLYKKIIFFEDEFLKIKSDWLIKNTSRDLIEEYLIKNQILN